MSDSEELVHIRADIPDDDGGGESFWAKPLGNSLYEIQNIVMLVPGLHSLDIVRCEEWEDTLPTVVELVRASGYRTIGITFRDDTGATEDQFVDVMWELRKKGVTSEKAARLIFFFAVPPETDYQEVVNFLREQEAQEILDFEELQEPFQQRF